MTGHTLNITAVGDISLGDHPVCVGHGMRSTFSKRGEDVFRNVEAYLKSSDITIGNLETIASNVGLNARWLPSLEMRGDPASLLYLKKAGIDLLGVANNHAMQHGSEAFQDCLKHLSAQKIEVVGVEKEFGKTAPFNFLNDGVSHTFFAISLRPEEWHDGPVPYSLRDNFDSLLAEVAELRASCEGFLVCSIHWGLELLDYPGPDEVWLGRALVDTGVDVVLGHHSHLLWPIERYKNGLIFYSLGNFTFDLWSRETKLSVIANLKLKQGQAPEYILTPVVIDDDFTLKLAGPDDKREILARLSEDQKQPKLTAAEYQQNHKLAVKLAKPVKYRYFLRNFYKYSPNFFMQSLLRTFLRRLTGR